MNCSPPGSSVHGILPGKNTRVNSHSLLQGIFPTQELNPSLLHCRQILYHLRHQWSPSRAVGRSNKAWWNRIAFQRTFLPCLWYEIKSGNDNERKLGKSALALKIPLSFCETPKEGRYLLAPTLSPSLLCCTKQHFPPSVVQLQQHTAKAWGTLSARMCQRPLGVDTLCICSGNQFNKFAFYRNSNL